MDIDINLSGLDELEQRLQKLADNAEALDGEHEVTGEELLPDDFIRQNTNFQTRSAFLNASGIKSQEDMATQEFDAFVAANTRFANWQEMFEAARAEWANRKLLSDI
jgi:hypothetical protein